MGLRDFLSLFFFQFHLPIFCYFLWDFLWFCKYQGLTRIFFLHLLNLAYLKGILFFD